MHALLARLTGKPAIGNWKDHVAAVEKDLVKVKAAFAPAFLHEQQLTEARLACAANPSPERCAKWLSLEATKPAAFAIEQFAIAALEGRRHEGMATGAAKFSDACAEARAELERRLTEIVADDQARTAEIGEPVESVAAKASIARRLEQIESAQAWFTNDEDRARGTLSTALGESM
jgi:hypothetical protein